MREKTSISQQIDQSPHSVHRKKAASFFYKNSESPAANPRQFFFTSVVQPKLTVNTPDDRYEKEADAVADQVMRMSASETRHPFFNPVPSLIQRQDDQEDATKTLKEGAGVVKEQLGETPGFEEWQEKQTEALKEKLWDNQPTEFKAGIIGFGLSNLGILGTVFATDPRFRADTIKLLNDKNLTPPLSLIPYHEYFPLSSFKYKLPSAEGAPITFDTEFGFKPYLDLMREKWSFIPKTDFTIGVSTSYSESGGLGFSGGYIKLKFGGGIIDLQGFLNKPLPPTPMLVSGNNPGEPPVWIMRSLPSQSGDQLPTGSGIFFTIDVLRLPQLWGKGEEAKPNIQRKCTECEKEEEQNLQRKSLAGTITPFVQRKEMGRREVNSQIASSLQATKGNRQPLPDNTRRGMESRFGTDFSQVNIRTDSQAVQLSQELNAQAFTHGRTIYFNRDKFSPGTREGKRLLAHELTHTIQQRGQLISKKVIQKNPENKEDSYATVVIKVPVDRVMAREEFIIYYLKLEFGFTEDHSKTILIENPGRFKGKWEVTENDVKAKHVVIHKRIRASSVIKETSSETISEPRLPNGRRRGYYKRKKEFDSLPAREKEDINKETDRRYWSRTQIPEGQKIKKGEEGNAEIWLDIRDEVLAQRNFIKNLPEKVKKFFKREKGGMKITPQDYEQITRISNRIILSLTDQEVDEYLAANPKPAENLDQFEKAIEAYIKLKRTAKSDGPSGDDKGKDTPKKGDDEKGKDNGGKKSGDDKGKGEGNGGDDDKKKSGSKYGVGLWDLGLPQEIIDVLEAALEALGDEEEMEAISETLRSLKDLSEHLDSIKLWFQDPSKLIPIVLGLEDNKAVETIEKWVGKPVKKKKLKPKKSKNRLVSLAKKLIRLVEKLRNILKPIFKVRGDFVNMFASIAGMIETVPMSGFLIDKISQKKSLDESLVRDFTNDLISRLQMELQGIRKMFALTPESFSDTDFVTYEDLAGAITHAVVSNIKHPVVKAASYIPGLENAIADNIVAKLIPKAALDSINGTIRNIVGPNVAAVSKAVGSDMEKLLNEVEQPLITTLRENIPKLVQKSPKDPGHSQHLTLDAGMAEDYAEDYIDKSHGKPLPEHTRHQMEGAFQHDFSKVRIYDDTYSHLASESLRANAFAMGENIFFGTNKFKPKQVEGQRLIAHELTHTIQQSNGWQAGVVQRDYKEYLDSLKSLLSKNVLAGLKPANTKDPALKKQAKEITDILQKVAGGKGNKGKGAKIRKTARGYTFPYKSLIERGYVLYKLNRKGIPTRIRRKIKFLGLLPALTIKKERIKLRALEKPKSLKDAARRVLRRNLILAGECRNRSKKEAHHVVPLELRNMKIVSVAESNNWNINGVNNGVCLTKNIHSGNHPAYTGDVRKALLAIERALIKKDKRIDWKNAKQPFETKVDEFKQKLKKRRSKLK